MVILGPPFTEEMIQERIAIWLHEERTRRHISLRALGRISGVDEKTLRRIENSNPKAKSYDPTYKCITSVTTLMRLCNVFEVQIASVFLVPGVGYDL